MCFHFQNNTSKKHIEINICQRTSTVAIVGIIQHDNTPLSNIATAEDPRRGYWKSCYHIKTEHINTSRSHMIKTQKNIAGGPIDSPCVKLQVPTPICASCWWSCPPRIQLTICRPGAMAAPHKACINHTTLAMIIRRAITTQLANRIHGRRSRPSTHANTSENQRMPT